MNSSEIAKHLENAAASLQEGHGATGGERSVYYQAASAEALIAIGGCLAALSIKFSGEYGVGEQLTEGVNAIRDTLESKLKIGA